MLLVLERILHDGKENLIVFYAVSETPSAQSVSLKKILDSFGLKFTLVQGVEQCEAHQYLFLPGVTRLF